MRTLDGTISGWNNKLGTNNAISQIAINNNAAGASYPGLAILNVSPNSYILAANFGTGNAVEVYDSTFKPTKLGGNFVDSTLPPNFSPFSVHVLGNQVFVCYALRTTQAPFNTVVGSGNGVVDVFDTSGNFVTRVVTFGNLNAPWGVALAPLDFGAFSHALLIGQFSGGGWSENSGTIAAYDSVTGKFLGQVLDASGQPLAINGLWALSQGNSATASSSDPAGAPAAELYFTAGPNQGKGGLFGYLKPVATEMTQGNDQ